jgi:hypothetical protein
MARDIPKDRKFNRPFETSLIKPTTKEVRLPSSSAPDFERQLAEAEAAGVDVVVLRAMAPSSPARMPAQATSGD